MVTTAQRSRGVCTHLHTIRIHLLSRRLCEPRGEPDGIQRDGRDHRDGRSVEQLGGVGANDEADDNARARSGGRLAVEGRARARDRARRRFNGGVGGEHGEYSRVHISESGIH